MQSEKVSVIVPIYNVEKYIHDCIDSILHQTYTNLEIILVDDGSPDACPGICDEYARIDGRIKVIHKVNGGLSDARNSGMNEASGQYLTFVDSDDYLNPQFIEILLQLAVQEKADICVSSYTKVDDNNNEIITQSSYSRYIYSGKKFLEELYTPKMKGVEFVTWGKLYNIRFFRNTGVVFPKGKLHEDTFTTYKIVYQASKVVFTTFEGYYYRIRENSIMTEAFNLRHLDLLEATEESCNFFFKCEEMLLYDMAVNNHIRCCFRIYLEIVKEFGENCIITSTFRKQYFDNALALMKKTDMPVVKKIVYGMAANTKNLWLISRLLQYSKRRSIQ